MAMPHRPGVTRGVLGLAVTLLLAGGATAPGATYVFTNAIAISATNMAYDGNDLIFRSCTGTVDGAHTFSSLQLVTNAMLRHSVATASNAYSLRLTLTSNLVIDASSRIDVTACGYPEGYTLGNTTNGAATYMTGGSYGGLGYTGNGSYGVPNKAYGDYRDPNELGSGGAATGSGAGGGLVRIAAGTAQIDGLIQANGGAYYWNGLLNNSGGSGGGIRLDVGTLSGGGWIRADGTPGYHGTAAGGGRVAVYYSQTNGFDLLNRVTAHGGIEVNYAGAPGTVYLKKAGEEGLLLITSHVVTNGSWTPLGVASDTVFRAERVVVAGSNVVVKPEHDLPLRVTSFDLQGGALLTHRPTTTTQVYRIDLAVTNALTVDALSRIDVTACGYPEGYTYGNVTNGSSGKTSGGSYGGMAYVGDGSYGIPNRVYGDYRNPNEPGSGGAAYGSGAGGGLVCIAAATAQIDGLIQANGGAYYWNGLLNNSGGSGGGIRLDVGTLSGSGWIRADGTPGYHGTAAGGGRVAVYYSQTNTFDATNRITAHGGIQVNYAGAPGTVYLKKAGEDGLLLITSHIVTNGSWTPLGVATDTVFTVDHLLVSGSNVVAAPEHTMRIEAKQVTLTNRAMLTHQPATAAAEYMLNLSVSGRLYVDPVSRIDVASRGYLCGRTWPNTTIGGATSSGGGSYGGKGYGVGANQTYGDSTFPNEVGSGGGVWDYGWSWPGGGLIRISAEQMVIDGEITADGGSGSGYICAGSGGGILLNVGDLSGAGTIHARGGNAGYGGGGGGGRVALYSWGALSMPATNITATGGVKGSGTGAGAAGTVYFASQPSSRWLKPAHNLLHGTATLEWLNLGLRPFDVSGSVRAFRAGQTYALGSAGSMVDATVTWNTVGLPDGQYEIRATFTGTNGLPVKELSYPALVNNSVIWHTGTVASNETWAAGTVHVVDGTVSIPSNITVTVGVGAVVKFATGSAIAVATNGTFNAQGAPGTPVVLTALADDSAGGDVNLDGSQSSPQPGDWNGWTCAAGGTVQTNGDTDVRYAKATHTGSLIANETWSGTYLHHVIGDVTVESGTTLTLEPGAVVKMAAGRNLIVKTNALLRAAGTLSKPVILTSLLDDTVSGDSNGDGSSTQPAAGNWHSIDVLGGRLELTHTEIAYGGSGTGAGGTWSGGDGAVHVAAGAQVLIADSLIRDSLYEGIACWGGGTVAVSNTVIRQTDRAINADGAVVTVTHCTLYGNGTGLWPHGGAIDVYNSIISHSTVENINSTARTLRYSNVWSPSAPYGGAGSNGNVSTNPLYKSAAAGNFRLQYRSPCIDSAEGATAGAADATGAPRYDDPRTANTGTPTGSGAYPDMGAFEFVETAASDLDLVAFDIQGPTLAEAGGTVTVEWKIRNVGVGTVSNGWHDAIALVPANLDWRELLDCGEAPVSARLGPNGAATFSAQVRVPGGTEGPWRWVIKANSRGEVFEGINWTNNTAAGTASVELRVPELVIGSPARSGLFDAEGQSHWFKFTPAAGADVSVELACNNSGADVELHMSRGRMPTRVVYETRQPQVDAAEVSVLASGAAAQPYYVLAYPARLPAAASFDIQARALEFGVEAVNQHTVGTAGPVTIRIDGGQLEPDMQYVLTGPGGSVTASQVFMTDSAHAYATFSLTGMVAGAYSVRVVDGGRTSTLANAVTVVTNSPGQFQVTVSSPSALRTGNSGYATVEYRNIGRTDLVAPLFQLIGTGDVMLWNTDVVGPASETLTFLGLGPEGPAGILAPGAEGRITVAFAQRSSPPEPGWGFFDVKMAESAGTQMNWSVSDVPDSVPADAWPHILSNYVAEVGHTVGGFNAALADNATYLSRFGIYERDVAVLGRFELLQAGDFGAIGERFALGPFGRGRGDLTPRAHVSSNGTVLIRHGYSVFRNFSLYKVFGESHPSYRAGPGDYGQLLLTNNTFRLTEPNGTRMVFGTNGLLAYVEDANSNRTTMLYAGGLLTGWTNTFGLSAGFEYNASGRVIRATDAVGRVTEFGYDASCEHLAEIRLPDGTTNRFTYFTGTGDAREHALHTATAPSGVQQQFDYDQHGRLERVTRNGGTPVGFFHDSAGGLAMSNALGHVSWTYRDSNGRSLCNVDALGNSLTYRHDSAGNLMLVTGPLGIRQSADYDAMGRPVLFRDPLNNSVSAAYAEPFGGLATLGENPLAPSVSHEYDARGNMVSTAYPDGRRETVAVDGRGVVTNWVNARNRAIRHTRSERGLLLRKDFADGSYVLFSYDSTWNPTSVVKVAAGGQSLTNTLTYDTADRLIRLTDPRGRELTFTYDAAGRRTALATDDGGTNRYVYDTDGRLAALVDGAGRTNVAYGYDAIGRLAGKRLGNGVMASFEYDAAGRMIRVTHTDTNSGVLGQEVYTYDALGRRTSATTAEGRTDYTYDALGRLTAVALPGRTIAYEYDARGNRTAVVNDGTRSEYLGNPQDQYTAAGGWACQYDADGNLVERTAGGVTWTYAYDDESRLAQVTAPGVTWQYEYDGLGQRIASVSNGVRTEYLIDPSAMGDLVAEYDGAGALRARYHHGLGLASREDAGGARHFYAFDGTGNTTGLYDENGVLRNRYTYLPFGEPLRIEEAVPNPFHYSGASGVQRDGSGLDYMRNRYYDPVTGRFLQRDPIGILGGLNLYAYAGNNPVTDSDPAGLQPIGPADAVAAYEELIALRQFLQSQGVNVYQLREPITGIIRNDMMDGRNLGYWMQQGYLQQQLSFYRAYSYDVMNSTGYRFAQWWQQFRASAGQTAQNFGAHVSAACAGAKAYGNSVLMYARANPMTVAKGGAAVTVIGYGGYCWYSALTSASWWDDVDYLTDGWLFRREAAPESTTQFVGSEDPNDITGPAGYGAMSYVMIDMTMNYLIRYENKTNATAPAVTVVVTNVLDPALDYNTFELGNMGFGTNVVEVPSGRTFFQTRVDARESVGLYVDIRAEFNRTNGMVVWRFAGVDPVTSLSPEDPFAGFLPPNTNAPCGEGWLRYSVRPATNLASGAAIPAKADIVFDSNPIIATPEITNHVDSLLPSSAIAPLSGRYSHVVPLQWSGDDAVGAGVACYDIFVSCDGAPYGLWLSGATNTSAQFPSESRRTYRFYSVAHDNVGYQEPAPSVPDAAITTDLGPAWWYSRNIIKSACATNDYAALNQGQLKWLATNACSEMEAVFPGGAGTGVIALVQGFTASNNYRAVNLGQLKNAAKPFYDRLIALGKTNVYPWANAPQTNNYGAANIGQAKQVFSFDISN